MIVFAFLIVINFSVIMHDISLSCEKALTNIKREVIGKINFNADECFLRVKFIVRMYNQLKIVFQNLDKANPYGNVTERNDVEKEI